MSFRVAFENSGDNDFVLQAIEGKRLLLIKQSTPATSSAEER
jgi:hypothetical protein